jgi:hypothetical protein
MSPANEIKVMFLEKLIDDVAPKTVTYPALIVFPVCLGVGWVGP